MLHPLLKNTRFSTLDWKSLPAHLRTLLSHNKTIQPWKPTSILNIINKRNTPLLNTTSPNIVVVAPWTDFPLNIPAELSSELKQRGLKIEDVNWIISKTDQCPGNKENTSYNSLLNQHLGTEINGDKIFEFNQTSPNLERLMNLLTNHNEQVLPTYLIGPVNSGKSTIVKHIINNYYTAGIKQNPNFGISNKLTSGQKPITKPRVWQIPSLEIVDIPGWISTGNNINEFGGIFAHVSAMGRSHLFNSVQITNKESARLSKPLNFEFKNGFKSLEISKMIFITPKGRFGENFNVELSGDLPSRPLLELKNIKNNDIVGLLRENPFIKNPKWKSQEIKRANSFDLIIESVGSVHVESNQVCDWKIVTPKLVSIAIFKDGKLANLDPLTSAKGDKSN